MPRTIHIDFVSTEMAVFSSVAHKLTTSTGMCAMGATTMNMPLRANRNDYKIYFPTGDRPYQ